MTASLAHRIERSQIMLVALSAPRLLTEPRAFQPPVVAVAPLAQGLTIQELAVLNRIRKAVS